jgi:gamma-glutamyltranspeptidase / glutathione hydrolase
VPSPRLAAAAGNKLGAEAAAGIARSGGNAIDACLASAIMAWVAEPFFGSIGGSGFVSLQTPEGEVEVHDGNNIMPFTAPHEPGQGLKRVFFPDYGDGIYTGIGGGSVGVPGVLSAIRSAWESHGRIEWKALFEDAIAAARDGLPLSRTSAYYLSVTWHQVWSQYDGARALFERDGRPLREGELLVQPELAEALGLIASHGPDIFYAGELGRAIAASVQADAGFLTVDDLRRYETAIRAPITTEAWGWKVSSNPPPSVGGAVLVHMLALLHGADLRDPVARLSAIVAAQRAAMGYRRQRYQDPGGIAAALDEAIAGAGSSMPSSATTHSAAADADGYVCSLTESNGYGAGLVVHGMLLNNTLGEEELNPLGVHGLQPGSRCHSNMAPTVAAGGGRTVGLGSPGADRIVGAIAQTLIRLALDGSTLADAVAAPRAHLDPRPQGETLCYEPGLPGDELGFIARPYDDIHMFFGGVQAASVSDDGTVDACHDPRRSGGHILI